MVSKVQGQHVTWIDIKNPREKDVRFLTKSFPFIDKPVLNEIIPPGHRAKVERHNDYIFLVLYYPIFNPHQKQTQSRELDIIVTKDHIITSHYKTIIPVKKIFDRINLYPENKEEYLNGSPGILLYHLIVAMLDSALNKLGLLERGIDQIEEAIFSGHEREMVTEISLTKRDIINFRRILAPQLAVIESLRKEGETFFGEFIIPYLEDMAGYLSRVWNTVEDHRETIEALEGTNNSLLSTKTNQTMKLLAIFSVIVYPLTLASSIWGMNLHYLPFVNSMPKPWDFILVLLVMSSLSVAVFVYLKIKKWF